MQLEWFQLELRYEHLHIYEAHYTEKLSSSIAHNGQQTAVIVFLDKEKYVVVDGYQRIAALKALNRDTIEAIVYEQSEIELLLLSQGLEHNRHRSALEDGWLLCELMARFDKKQSELSVRLNRSISWISRRIGLVRELPLTAQDLVRRGKVSAYGAMKYLLPLARAKREDCELLVEKISRKGLSSRSLEKIYKGYKSATIAERHQIVSNPYLYLNIVSTSKKPSAYSRLHQKLIIAGQVLLQARRELESEILHDGALSNPDVLSTIWHKVDKYHMELSTSLQEYFDARVRDT